MKKILIGLTILLCASSARAQSDMIDLSRAVIVNAPDVRAWPIKTAITSVSFDGATTRVDFDKRDGANRWPDVTPSGWTGPLEYTLWLFVNHNGLWVGSAFIQFWNGRDGSGNSNDPDVPSVYDKHWYYAERWSPLFGHGPITPEETIGFMVTSGNQRDNVGPDSVRERSNLVTFPARDRATFAFTAAPPPVVAPPAPTLLLSNELGQLFTQGAINHAAEMAMLAELQTQVAATRQDIAEFRAAVRSRWVAIVDSPIVKYGLAMVSGWFITHAVSK